MAAQLGYCGLDRRRAPLVGDEIRACWEATAVAAEPVPGPAPAVLAPPSPAPGAMPRSGRDFIEIEPATPTATASAAALSDPPVPDELPAAIRDPRPEPGWSLWADLEG